MTVYVAEISGRGIAAFDAASEAEAAVHLADKAFVRDLIVLRSQGRPLWMVSRRSRCEEHPPRRPWPGSPEWSLVTRTVLSFSFPSLILPMTDSTTMTTTIMTEIASISFGGRIIPAVLERSSRS